VMEATPTQGRDAGLSSGPGVIYDRRSYEPARGRVLKGLEDEYER